jgi:hypothetical protein
MMIGAELEETPLALELCLYPVPTGGALKAEDFVPEPFQPFLQVDLSRGAAQGLGASLACLTPLPAGLRLWRRCVGHAQVSLLQPVVTTLSKNADVLIPGGVGAALGR